MSVLARVCGISFGTLLEWDPDLNGNNITALAVDSEAGRLFVGGASAPPLTSP